jgi:hypothetical protein
LLPVDEEKRGWGARIRTWDHETKTRCLTAWPRPNTLFEITIQYGVPSYQYRHQGVNVTLASPGPLNLKARGRESALLRAASGPFIYGPSSAMAECSAAW